MNKAPKEPMLTYALDSAGRLVNINSVERGLACKCFCPKCKEPLIAKKGNEGGRQPHFAHLKDSFCEGATMTAMHMLAEHIIAEEMTVMAPQYNSIGARQLYFKKIEVEQRVDRIDLQPDLVGITEDGLRWIIEIRNTHEIDDIKRNKLIESKLTCLEIDVREQELDKDKLKSFLLHSVEGRSWICNSNDEDQITKEKQRKLSIVEKGFEEKASILLPAYGKYEEKRINIEKILSIDSSDQDISSNILIKADDGNEYMFHVGFDLPSYTYLSSPSRHKDYSELNVNLESISTETDISFDSLNIEWMFHYESIIETKKMLDYYRNNPEYKIRKSNYCNNDCKYKPYQKECIYNIINDVYYEGEYYVICHEQKRKNDLKVQPNTDSIPTILEKPKEQEEGINLSRISPIRLNYKKDEKQIVSDEERDLIEYYYSYLNKKKIFYSPEGEKKEILNIELAKRCCGIIVEFCIEDSTPYYIYGISIEGKKYVYKEINDYESAKFADIFFKRFVNNWKYENDSSDINPFEDVSSECELADSNNLFQENRNPVPF